MPAGAECSILRKFDTCRCSEAKRVLLRRLENLANARRRSPEKWQNCDLESVHSLGVEEKQTNQ